MKEKLSHGQKTLKMLFKEVIELMPSEEADNLARGMDTCARPLSHRTSAWRSIWAEVGGRGLDKEPDSCAAWLVKGRRNWR